MLLQTPRSTLSIKCNYKSEWGRASANSDRNVGAGLRFSVTKLKNWKFFKSGLIRYH